METTRPAIPSAYHTISSNRSIGNSMSSAVADIIDNSNSANAQTIALLAPSLEEELVNP